MAAGGAVRVHLVGAVDLPTGELVDRLRERRVGFLARDAVMITRSRLGPVTVRPRSEAALRAHDRLLRAERADRVITAREGISPIGGSPVPIGPGLLDLERDFDATVEHVTLLVTSALRRRPLLAYSRHWIDTAVTTGEGRCTDLAAAVPHIGWQLAKEIHPKLDGLDQRVRAAVGLDPDWWPLPGDQPCLACGRRSLAVQTSAPDSGQWTLTCTSTTCVCQGRCNCGMSSRPAGIRHIWPASGTPAVQQLLTRIEPPGATRAA